MPPHLALLVSAGSVGWLALVMVSPLLSAPLAGPVYLFGSFICHQLAERSFHIDGAQLPVCARCFGIYCGAAAGSLYGLARLPVVVGDRALVLAAACTTGATVALEWGGFWEPSNLMRAVAGGVAGIAVALVVLNVIVRASDAGMRHERSSLAPH